MKTPAIQFEKQFAKLMEESSSLNDLQEILFDICKHFGVNRFILHEFLKENNQKRVYSTTSPDLEEWEHFYQVIKEYDVIDPIYDKTYPPFSVLYWTEDSFEGLTKKQIELFVDMKSFGISSGTTIPLISQMIKEEDLLSENIKPLPTYQHERFFTVLNKDISNDLDLIFKLSIIGNTYNKKKESFEYEKFSKTTSELEKDNTEHALLYKILEKGIYSMESKGLITFDKVYKEGLNSLFAENADQEIKIH